jgi:hypothetical protein
MCETTEPEVRKCDQTNVNNCILPPQTKELPLLAEMEFDARPAMHHYSSPDNQCRHRTAGATSTLRECHIQRHYRGNCDNPWQVVVCKVPSLQIQRNAALQAGPWLPKGITSIHCHWTTTPSSLAMTGHWWNKRGTQAHIVGSSGTRFDIA